MNGEALPHILGILSCWGIPTVIGVPFCPSVGGSSTQLNIVTGGGQQLSMGLSILRPSNMSHWVMVMNSPMVRYSSLTLSAKG